MVKESWGGCQSRAQNKTPQTRSSRGTYVDQPSPKCCSIESIGERRELVNGTQVLYASTRVLDRLSPIDSYSCESRLALPFEVRLNLL
jgi:hypothetical protein